MSNTKRIKAPTGISFKGIFKWPKLAEPDFGTEQYPKPGGEFSLKLVGSLESVDVQNFIAKWQPMHDEAIKNAQAAFKALPVATRKKLEKVSVNPLYTEIYDEETEQPTGDIEIKFSLPYSGEYKKGPKAGQKWYRRPDLFDAAGNKLGKFKGPKVLVAPPDIWGGTVGRVAFEVGINPEGVPGYFIAGTGAAGLSLRLQAARIIDLVSGGERNASAYGFDDEEEGYVHTPDTDVDTTSDEGSSDGVEASDNDNPDF